MARKHARHMLRAPIFKAVHAEVTPKSAAALAKAWFGISAKAETDSHSVKLTDGARFFQQFSATGAVLYLDRAALDASDKPVDCDDAEAFEHALAFLKKIGRTPEAIGGWRVKPGQVKLGDENAVVNHLVVEITLLVRVRSKGGGTIDVPLIGSGVTRVMIGPTGAVVGLALHCPELVQADEVELLDPRQARSLIDWASACGGGHHEHAPGHSEPAHGDALLAYWLDAPTVPQPQIAPVYIMSGVEEAHGLLGAAPATKLLPVARIKPLKAAKPGSSPRFKAEVANGKSPYRYRWRATLEKFAAGGWLQEGQVFSSSLHAGAHYLCLEVTDARGFRAEAAVNIVAITRLDALLGASSLSEALAAAEGSGRLALPSKVEALAEKVAHDFYDEERKDWVCVDPGSAPDEPTVLNLAVAGAGWTMSASITSNDGLELNNIRYMGALVASSFSVPFYYIETTLMPWQRAELNHPPAANPQGNCFSWLLAPGIVLAPAAGGGIAVIARWCVDRLPAPGKRPLMIVEQRFEFGPATRTMAPVPFNLLAEAPFFPLVTHRFFPQAGNTLKRIEFNYRLDFDIRTANDQCALTREANAPFPPPIFVLVSNPVPVEASGIAVGGGGVPGAAGTWDNYHQAPDYASIAPLLAAAAKAAAAAAPGYGLLQVMQFFGLVSAPNFPLPIIVPLGSLLPNDCIHMHWRWGAFLAALGFAPPGGGVGRTAAPGQLVEVYAVRYMPGERDPVIVNALLNNQPIVGKDIVFWYRAMSIGKLTDTFFQHGGFFV